MAEKGNLLDLLRKTLELAMPDLRHYYRVVKKAQVVASYASDGRYYADVQPLRNDGTKDENEPVVPKVEIPVLWAGPRRGVVCPPMAGTLCDLSYYDGDPQYPTITNFRHAGGDAPAAALNEFVIQLEPGVEIRIDREKQIVTLTPENVTTRAGKNWTIEAGDNATIKAGKDATLKAGAVSNIISPLINLCGRVVCKSFDGKGKGRAEFEGDVVIRGNQEVTENTTTGGNSSVNGNSYAGSRSGGSCPH